jgi:putative oxidoreductase
MTMQGKRTTFGWWIELAIRLVVGGVFIYAGVIKLPEPIHFADNIASFRILPPVLVNPLALSLPWFEILAGALLISGFARRVGALALLLVTSIYCAAIAYALARGLVIDCGCFGGGGIPSATKMRLDLARDMLLFAGTLVVYLRARRGVAIDEPAGLGSRR